MPFSWVQILASHALGIRFRTEPHAQYGWTLLAPA